MAGLQEELPLAKTTIEPVSNDELVDFRSKWINEVLDNKKGNSRTLAVSSSSVSSSDGDSAALVLAAVDGKSRHQTKSGKVGKVKENEQPVISKVDKVLDPVSGKTYAASVASTSSSSRKGDSKPVMPQQTIPQQQHSVHSTAPLQQSSPKESEALILFGQASQFERQGNLNQALLLFRQASRMYPDVERAYRQVLYQEAASGSSSSSNAGAVTSRETADNFETYYGGLDENSADLTFDAIDMIVDIASREGVKFTPKHKLRKPPLFQKLPGELVTQILQHCVLYDIGSLCSISLVCKKFLIQVRERSLWRFVGERTFLKPANVGLVGVPSLMHEVGERYGDDWLRMFVDKPRVRTDGVFISRINYVRQGYGEAWNQPIHVVSYYRYLRFLPRSGICYAWMTTLEPSQVVKVLNNQSRKEKGFMVGAYRVTEMDGACHIFCRMKDYERPRTTFEYSLTLTSTKRGRHNKLGWISYHMHNGETKENASEVPLKTLRPFMFSKVRSYLVAPSIEQPKNVIV
ncbi:hypothetical protein SmJEL517_g04917 [Synchytrium microbalum]|uniref:F-box domain-containing protein n=1 Tax=Synchytrium microbalum TaxID=1806994 RepID=A0A507C1N2_9FUNG|nr:uncharacterized protein SmJEL517_g04917 [Synchytrium microbalum]TPX31856.1 hypothetical protein SmJEL517_g04917 [Synchytrium microbalum]